MSTSEIDSASEVSSVVTSNANTSDRVQFEGEAREHLSSNEADRNASYGDMPEAMSQLSMHPTQAPHQSRPYSLLANRYPSRPTMSLHPTDTQAELSAFTPPLMSLQFHQQGNRPNRPMNYRSPRPYVQNSPSFIPVRPTAPSAVPQKSKSETTVSPPEYYVDSFASNFSDKSSSTSASKAKAKHVSFQEPAMMSPSSEPVIYSNHYTFGEVPLNDVNGLSYDWSNSPQPMYHSSRTYPQFNENYYHSGGYYYGHPQRFYTGSNPSYRPRPRATYPIPTRGFWRANSDYGYQSGPSLYPSWQPKQLYDPNKPTVSAASDASKVTRSIPPQIKKKPRDVVHPSTSTLSVTAEPFTAPSTITILRKPTIESEVTTPVIPPPTEDVLVPLPEEDIRPASPVATETSSESTLSFPSDELLSILQSANCISALNEYAQQKKFSLSYEYSSPHSSALFSCAVSIDGQRFSSSTPCASKNEAQKLACDQALRTLYRQSCAVEPATSVLSSKKHDLIAQRSVAAFQDLNVNSSLLGRKTLACILMVRNGRFDQGRVISIATGNSCLDQTNLSYADDGSALHDCHAEILARRGLIRFLLVQMKQTPSESIFDLDATDQKYRLKDGITFHMYISALPCGNASLNIPSNSLRYKQGQTEGTQLASTTSVVYPIKSCTDKICRWNIVGIQGGLVINLLTKPIYLESITLACETSFDRSNVQRSLAERLKEHCRPLPTPYLFNLPDIDCPQIKSFQQERQVAKLQTNAFAWNVTQPDKTELLEPMTGRLKNDRSVSSLSKRSLLQDFTDLIESKHAQDTSLAFTTYQQAKQRSDVYVQVKNLLSSAFGQESTDSEMSWLSKSNQLEQFSIQ